MPTFSQLVNNIIKQALPTYKYVNIGIKIQHIKTQITFPPTSTKGKFYKF